MAHAVPHLESLVGEAGFTDIERGEVPPVLQYVRATNGLPLGYVASSI